MQAYNDLVKLARICLRQAREAKDPALGKELKRMASEYQQRAARLDSSALADIDE
jgi:hypothetical protein